MASRSSSDSAGEQRLEMDSYSVDRKNNEHSRDSRTNGQMRVAEARVGICCMERRLQFKDVIDFTVRCKCTQLCFPSWICRNCKPRNRPSFRQILLHLDIASADVLSTPQETYFKSQVRPWSTFKYSRYLNVCTQRHKSMRLHMLAK